LEVFFVLALWLFLAGAGWSRLGADPLHLLFHRTWATPGERLGSLRVGTSSAGHFAHDVAWLMSPPRAGVQCHFFK